MSRRSQYTVWDRAMVKEAVARSLLCSWLGHKFTIHKMYDDVCARCSTSRPRER